MIQEIRSVHTSQSPDTHLHGSKYAIVCIIWCAMAILTISLFFSALPYYFTSRRTPCTTPETCVPGQLPLSDAPFLQELGVSVDAYAVIYTMAVTFGATVHYITAIVLFWRKSNDWMAMFVSLEMLSFGTTWSTVLTPLEHVYPAWRPVGYLLSVFSFLTVMLSFYLFPNGQFVPQRTKLLVPVVFYTAINQLASVYASISFWQISLFLGLLITGAFCQVYRYRRLSNSIERQQTKWVMWAASITVLCCVLAVLLVLMVKVDYTLGTVRVLFLQIVVPMLLEIPRVLIPVAMAVAILRYRLWDISIVINRTLVYIALSLSVVGLYVLIVVSLSILWQVQGNLLISLVGTAFVAVAFQPLREKLQHAVNRLMYGERDDPYAVLSRLGQRLESTISPDAVLVLIVTTIQDALKLPYVAIALLHIDRFIVAAAVGTPPLKPIQVSLVYQNEVIGQLMLGERSMNESFSPSDQRLLNDLARHAGVAVHAVRLTIDLQGTRERLVTTREEERRHLRNDLHDRLGGLGALALKIGSARDLMYRDRAIADSLLSSVEAEIGSVAADLRDLAHQLRPPVIDQLGLVEALCALADQYEHSGLRFDMTAPDQLPSLPAAIEVALYRIAQEAMNNIVRHSQARSCRIHFWIGECVYLIVADDGIGMSNTHPIGVGLASMRERAEELGGTCDIKTTAGRGTSICVSFPIKDASFIKGQNRAPTS